MAPRSRVLLILALPTLALVLAMNCATTPNPNAAKYPPRPGGCKVRVFHTPAPDVKKCGRSSAWRTSTARWTWAPSSA